MPPNSTLSHAAGAPASRWPHPATTTAAASTVQFAVITSLLQSVCSPFIALCLPARRAAHLLRAPVPDLDGVPLVRKRDPWLDRVELHHFHLRASHQTSGLSKARLRRQRRGGLVQRFDLAARTLSTVGTKPRSCSILGPVQRYRCVSLLFQRIIDSTGELAASSSSLISVHRSSQLHTQASLQYYNVFASRDPGVLRLERFGGCARAAAARTARPCARLGLPVVGRSATPGARVLEMKPLIAHMLLLHVFAYAHTASGATVVPQYTGRACSA